MRCRPGRLRPQRQWRPSRGRARNRSALRQVLFHGQSCPLLVVFMFEALAGRAKVDDSQQHEDERLNETDEDDIEALPYDKDQGTDDGGPDGAHHWQLKTGKTRDQADHDGPSEDVAEETK